MKNRKNNIMEELDITRFELLCGCRQIPHKMILIKFQPKGWFTRFDTAYYKCTVCGYIKKAYIHEPLFFGQPELIVEELTD